MGLIGFATLGAGFGALPLAAPHVGLNRPRVKSFRAAMRGALFVGKAGVVLQTRGNDCGAACLKMVLSARGIEHSLPYLVRELETTPRGASMLSLRLVAARLGLPARSWVISDADLDRAPLPMIAFVRQNHFVVIRRWIDPEVLEVDDPAVGRLQWPLHSFRKSWHGEALVFDPAWSPS
jgi:ATP-binding cassette subfamily B protein RaxB